MNAPIQSASNEITLTNTPEHSRRSFLRNAALTGASLAALTAVPTRASAEKDDDDPDNMKYEHDHLRKGDRDILVAAEIAEALAVTTYTNIINIAPFFKQIPSDDQDYLIAARQEEMSHYCPRAVRHRPVHSLHPVLLSRQDVL